jgi:hypothetical protein
MKIGNRRRPKDARPHQLAPQFVAQKIKEDQANSEPPKPLTWEEQRSLAILDYALSGLRVGLRKQ